MNKLIDLEFIELLSVTIQITFKPIFSNPITTFFYDYMYHFKIYAVNWQYVYYFF